MPPQVRPAVEREIRELERCDAIAESRCVWRVCHEVRRLLIRYGQRVCRALPEDGDELLVEGDPADAVVPLEEGVEVGSPKCRLSRRAGVFELSSPDDAQC